MNKIIIIVIAVIAGILGLMLWGNSAQNTADAGGGGKSALSADEVLYDFGTISMAKGNVNKIFKISNPTDKDITVKTLTTSCMCTKAYIEKGDSEKGPFGMPSMGSVPPANEIIKAGGIMEIKVVYDPAAHGPSGVGSIDRFVYLTDGGGGKIQLEIKAKVTP